MKREKSTATELIGSQIEVCSSTNPCDVGLKGKVADETKETLVILLARGHKRLLKKNIIFIVGSKKIKGSSLRRRPEDRIKGK